MKVLFVIDSLGSGGAQRQIVTIAKGFKEKGHEVSFLVYHHKEFFLNEILNSKIAYTCIEERILLKRFFRMRRHIRKGNYAAVISFLAATNFITTLSGFPYRKWKLIVGERNANPNILKSFKLRFYRLFHFFADYVVANSNANIEIIKKVNPLLPKSKYRVIYNSINHDFWKPSLAYIPFKNGKLNILVAASHQYHKNTIGLIEGIRRLPKDFLNKIVVNWYGDLNRDTSYEKSLDLIKKYKLESVVIFYKAERNILEKMQMADVIGLFSLYEGLPNVICEALTIGKPVLVSSVSDLPLILSNTENILFNPNEPIEIKRALEKIIDFSLDSLKSTGKQNRVLGIQKFNGKRIIQEYLALLS